MSARLRAWLAREGVVSEGALRAAEERQQIYGGALDTALLERGVMSEPALWARLAAATGLPAPAPALCEGERATVPPPLAAEVTGPLRAVPVAVDGRTVELLCAEPVAADAIRAAVQAHGFVARLYVVPEGRLLAMRQRVYGEPLPARYAPLLARAVGAARARRGSLAAPGGVSALPQPSPQPQPPSLPLPATRVAAVTEGWTAQTRGDDQVPTPLEHFLDLSGPLSTSASGEAGGWLTELEVEMEVDLQANDPASAQPVDGLPEVAITGPARLEVLSSAPAETGVVEMEAAPMSPAAQAAPAWQAVSDGDGDFATEALCRRARDPGDKGRLLALRALRQRMTHPATQALIEELRALATGPATTPAESITAIEALGELRDGAAIPLMIDKLAAPDLSSDVADATHRMLVVMTAQDLGRSRRRWQTWAREHAAQPRVQWLIDGLAHKNPSIRTDAAEELRHLAGDSFGYVARSPKNERERARRRFVTWWQELSGPRTATSGPVSSPNPGSPGEEGAFLAPGEEVPLPPTPKAR